MVGGPRLNGPVRSQLQGGGGAGFRPPLVFGAVTGFAQFAEVRPFYKIYTRLQRFELKRVRNILL